MITEKDLKKIKNVNKEEEFLRLNIACFDKDEEEKEIIENKISEDENSDSIEKSD